MAHTVLSAAKLFDQTAASLTGQVAVMSIPLVLAS
jgi:hypothetical protein